jgi:Tc toxin complex TcA C-terminal TcB-binding domain
MLTNIIYDINVNITKINGIASTPNMDILGANIAIEGTANATKETITTDRFSGEVISDVFEDVTSSLDVFIKFGNSSTTQLVTTIDNWKTWSLTVPVPNGNANADGQLLITVIAQLPDSQQEAATTVTVLVKNQATIGAIARSVIDSNLPNPTTLRRERPGEDPEPPVDPPDDPPPRPRPQSSIKLTILSPFPDQTVALGGSVPLTVKAMAEVLDGEGNVIGTSLPGVGWSLNNRSYNNPIALDSTGIGTTQITIADVGKQTIYVVARIGFGSQKNEIEQDVTVDVASPLTPVDPADLTGPIAYLSDLLGFAAKRINVGASPSTTEATLPSAAELSNIFYQRFQELLDPQNRAAGLQNIHQIRIGVDILRKYLLSHDPQWQNRPQDLTVTESNYRQQAYNALLSYLGTSPQELRRALTGDPATKTLLANRLGVEPEALAGLLLSSDQITEETLELIFGLTDTHFLRDSFAANVSPPTLLVKRKEHLQRIWGQQDDAARYPNLNIPIPVLDPDLLQADDLKSSTATDLWNQRREQVQTLLNDLRAIPGNNLARFTAAVNLALKPGASDRLKGLFAKYQLGENIESQLQELSLELPPFLYLKQIDELIETNIGLIDDEWEQTFSILVQVQKLRDRYSTWHTEEIEKGITLGPDDFKLPSSTADIFQPTLWRATQLARQTWQARLKARINQEEALTQELKSVVDSAEVIALPVLRDHLINLVRQSIDPPKNIDAAEELTAELFVDFKTAPAQKTTFVAQAIETLQGILFALRMGRLATTSPVVGATPVTSWQLQTNIRNFDEEWQWMGTYATWRSAMNVFLFPENFLQPTTRPLTLTSSSQATSFDRTIAFNDLVKELRAKPRLTPSFAQDTANQYLANLKAQSSVVSSSLGSFSFQAPTSSAQIEALRSVINTIFSAVAPNATKFQEVPTWIQEVFYFVPVLLAQQLERSGEYLTALDWYKAVFAYTLPPKTPQSLGPDPRKIYQGLILEENDLNNFPRTDDWLLDDFNPHKIAQTRANVYTRFTIRSLAQCLIAFADDQFTQETVESIPQARTRYLEALDLLNMPEMQATSQLGGKTLENSLLQSVRNHASMNLLKLRNGLNIAGLERPIRTETTIRTVTRRPTPYRYQALIERAKQLTATAGQIEASFLATLEKLDAEQYALLKAQQDIELSRTQVQLQNLRVNEAEDGVELAELQQDRTQIQVDYYQDLLRRGLLPAERDQLRDLRIASSTSFLGGLAQVGILGLGLASGGTTFLGLGAAAGVAGNATFAGGILSAASSILGAAGNAASTNAQLQSLRANFERRSQEWRQQLKLSRKDVVIGNQQIKLAQDHVLIAKQEFQIAVIQAEHAMETLNFLGNKFTNAELFDWMSRVLERVYAFFLQQATAIARLAEAQLAFERQEALPTFIQSDYWQAPSESSSTQGTDRRGLTGSARLLQAITELDQFAFLNDRRKLQMSKTFSLSALSPAEFQRFRETGVMLFGTPTEFFDRDFPGHYLRLLRQVRTTVIALIPPTQGIRATLTNLGVSRVTIDDGGFQDVEVHHGSQSVALSAPVNATGVFELTLQPDLLLPFEAIGVDSFWEFRLPKPANPFDFNTIADVLITFEYTALDSWDYRQQVIQRLDPNLSADRAFSLRSQFPDQWYDLHNPNKTTTPLTVKFKTLREDFPPNLDVISIQQVVMYFVRSRNATYQTVEVNRFSFTAEGSTDKVGGAATSIDDIISTRRGNASSWTAMIGKSPFGEWELSFPDTLQMRELFAKEQFEDILLVITYKGRSPAWPQ